MNNCSMRKLESIFLDWRLHVFVFQKLVKLWVRIMRMTMMVIKLN